MNRLRPAWIVAAAASLIFAPQAARSGIVTVASLAELGANDSINWGQFGVFGTVVLDTVTTFPGQVYDPFGPLSTTGGISVNGGARGGVNSPPLTTNVVIDELSGLPSLKMSYGEDGSFRPPGTGTTFERVLLTFDEPILGFGAEVFSWQELFPGNGFARLDPYDANFVHLGTSAIGQASLAPFQGFLGVQSDSLTPDIKYIEIVGRFDVNQNVAARGILEIGEIGLVTAPATTAVPEPASLVLFCIGGASMVVGWPRRVHRTRREREDGRLGGHAKKSNHRTRRSSHFAV